MIQVTSNNPLICFIFIISGFAGQVKGCLRENITCSNMVKVFVVDDNQSFLLPDERASKWEIKKSVCKLNLDFTFVHILSKSLTVITLNKVLFLER